MTPILHIQQLGKSFNGLTVLQNVSFSLAPGTTTALFGENGCGKTTLFNIISGFLQADQGQVHFKTQTLNGKSPVDIASLGVGRVWQTPRVCRNLSVLDNLLLATRDHPGESWLNYLIRPRLIFREERRRKAQTTQVAVDVGLSGKLEETAGSLSIGQQKLLSIGMLLMNDADLLMLDEPFAGVNARMVEHIAEVMATLKARGKTILLIEHNRIKAEQISDMTLNLVNGQTSQNDEQP